MRMVLGMIGIWLSALTCSPADTAVKGSSDVPPNSETLIQVTVLRLAIDPANQQPVVTLIDSDEKRVFLIWIGLSEARAIHSELQGTEHFRPLTHDLLAGIIEKIDGKIRRVVITHVRDNVFYATLVIGKDNSLIEMDARPSDSIIMALKFKAPIYISKSLFEKMSIPLEPGNEVGGNYGLSIQEITPELAAYLELKSSTGVMVAAVRPGSQAEKDGLKSGDILIEINGKAIEDKDTVQNLIDSSESSMRAKIIRGEQVLNITLHFK